jgi:guanylate kinase
MTEAAQHRRGELYVIAAPSGAGKTSLVRALMARQPRLALSVSDTTRPARSTERDGEQYCFIDRASFDAKCAAGRYLEHAEVFGQGYGTDMGRVETLWTEGRDVILEIDVQGAAQVRQRHPDVCQIFILPPSRTVLAERLRGRGTDQESVIARRLAEAEHEMAAATGFDWLITNDDFETALVQLEAVVMAWRQRCSRQLTQLKSLLASSPSARTMDD